MNEIITVEGTNLTIKTWKDQRVVTFKDIDEVHQRPEGTAKRNFNNNKKVSPQRETPFHEGKMR